MDYCCLQQLLLLPGAHCYTGAWCMLVGGLFLCIRKDLNQNVCGKKDSQRCHVLIVAESQKRIFISLRTTPVFMLGFLGSGFFSYSVF